MIAPKIDQDIVYSLTRATNLSEPIDELVSKILAEGKLHHVLPVPQDGCSLLTWLIEKGHTEQALRVIAAGADVRQASVAGYQPVHAAAAMKDAVVLPVLLAKGCSLHAAQQEGATAVHFAFCDTLSPQVAQIVLDHLNVPGRAFLKKGAVMSPRNNTVWEHLARFGNGPSELLQVLQMLDERGLIDELLQSEKPSSRSAAQGFQSALLSRFHDHSIGHWWRTREEVRDLAAQTPQAHLSRSRRM